MKFVIVSEKKWNRDIIEKLKIEYPIHEWILIDKKEDFTIENISTINPKKIFIPHWSYIIKKNVFEAYECIVFHMTDLPYGRGGSPLQNLIIRGHKNTRISALKVEDGIDTGGIYLKKEMSLEGNAKEIFERASVLIFYMIKEIIFKNLQPIKQEGEVVEFKRRTPEESDISKLESLSKVYDFIRMLDCEGYPNAYLETVIFKFEFTNAQLLNNEIIANVRITKK